MYVQEWGKGAESRKQRREEAKNKRLENEIAQKISAAVEDANHDWRKSNKETQTQETVVIDFFDEEDFTSDNVKLSTILAYLVENY